MLRFIRMLFSSSTLYLVILFTLLVGTPWRFALPILAWMFAVSFIK